jgi:Zn-dependent oligopeptidases
MSLRLCFFACALLKVAQITAVFAADLKDNPLAAESVLPYQYPAFDKIKDEHFVPAIEAGMREQLKEIEPIANDSEKPTFDNTIVALERTGRLLDRAERTFSNLNACDTNPTRQKIDKEMAPKLAAHHDEIFLNPKLFARVKALYEKRDELGSIRNRPIYSNVTTRISCARERSSPMRTRKSSRKSMPSWQLCRPNSNKTF